MARIASNSSVMMLGTPMLLNGQSTCGLYKTD